MFIMLQALASDIDRTLFFHERNPHISDEDCEAIQNYQSHGHLFGYAVDVPIRVLFNYLKIFSLIFILSPVVL